MIHYPIVVTKGGFLYGEEFFKSKEEIYFLWYLDELVEHGFIKSYGRPESIEIFPAVQIRVIKGKKIVEKHLLPNLRYTADFSISWEPGAYKYFYDEIEKLPSKQWQNHPFMAKVYNSPNIESIIDVKGGFGGTHNNSAVSFPIIQKILASRMHLYVQKIVPKSLFEKTFTPARYYRTDGGDILRQRNWEFKTIKEYVGKITRSFNPPESKEADEFRLV